MLEAVRRKTGEKAMAKTVTNPVAYLTEAEDALRRLGEMKARQSELELTEKRQAKTLAAEKKAVEDSVNNTVKKRRDELAAGYDGEIAKVQDAVKKIRAKREKAKQQGMKERIDAQNAPRKAEIAEMKGKIRAMFKQNHVPQFCNSLLFYSLYFPRAVKEVLTMLLTFFICCVGIPVGIFCLLPERKTLWLILIYLLVIVVFGGLYLAVGSLTKDAHREVLLEAQRVRRSIDKTRRKMRSTARSIRREKTEEHYDLSSFDSELAAKEREKEELQTKREEAMAYFNSTTKAALTEEIVSGSRDRINALEEEHAATQAQVQEAAEQVKKLSLSLTEDYESYIGKEFMQEERLAALIQILRSGQAASITDAKALYREQSGGKK